MSSQTLCVWCTGSGWNPEYILEMSPSLYPTGNTTSNSHLIYICIGLNPLGVHELGALIGASYQSLTITVQIYRDFKFWAIASKTRTGARTGRVLSTHLKDPTQHFIEVWLLTRGHHDVPRTTNKFMSFLQSSRNYALYSMLVEFPALVTSIKGMSSTTSLSSRYLKIDYQRSHVYILMFFFLSTPKHCSIPAWPDTARPHAFHASFNI